ncbi:MAG: sugar transferase [Bacteroidetes bacterium]|nr:sugar transferase [Bacteroidota bacterium]MBL7102850.1 sugar transferase [Bacteroidales bacterium]
MIKRFLEILFSLLSLIILSPLFLIIAFLIKIDSKGGAFYIQKRVGKNNKDFNLIKFRTMFVKSDRQGLLTVGEKDNRITGIGKGLRKHKIDELPQLINILKGEMSFVGPRPEVRKYVELYDDRQKQVLSVKSGLTDYASLEYVNENKILAGFSDPEKAYVEQIMPAKLELNLQYIKEQGLLADLKIIIKTLDFLVNPKFL